MPDITPVGNTVNYNPMQGLETLSGILGIQQKKQALQTGAYVQQQAKAGAQEAGMQMQDRNTLQQMTKTGVDPEGNSIMTDEPNPYTGRREIDPDRFAAAATKHMPVLGASVAQAALKTKADRTSLHSAVADLNTKFSDDLSGIVRAASADPSMTADKLNGLMDAYAQRKPGSRRDGALGV